MYIIVKNQFAYVKDEEMAKVAGMYTDAVTDEVFRMYSWDLSSYRIDGEGKFVKNREEAEQKAKWLNKLYIPNHSRSVQNSVEEAIKGTDKASPLYLLKIAGLYPEWKAGEYNVGDIVNYAGQTWKCIQAHNNDTYPDIIPSNEQTWHTFWAPLHGTTLDTARPWVKPQFGTTDMYHAGEYMIWTDGEFYKCISDTVYSPEEYAAAWAEHKNNWETQE